MPVGGGRARSHTSTPDWRPPRGLRGNRGAAAALVGGGGAWPGFEATRRAKLAARTTRGRAAAHGAARPNKAHAAPRTPAAQQAPPEIRRA